MSPYASIALCGCGAFVLYQTRNTAANSMLMKGLYGYLITHGLVGVLNCYTDLPESVHRAYHHSKTFSAIVPLVLTNQDMVGDDANLIKINMYGHVGLSLITAVVDVFWNEYVFEVIVAGNAALLAVTSVQKKDEWGILIAALHSICYFGSDYIGDLLNVYKETVFIGGLCGVTILNYFRQKESRIQFLHDLL